MTDARKWVMVQRSELNALRELFAISYHRETAIAAVDKLLSMAPPLDPNALRRELEAYEKWLRSGTLATSREGAAEKLRTIITKHFGSAP